MMCDCHTPLTCALSLDHECEPHLCHRPFQDAQPVRSGPGPDQCFVSLSLVTSHRMKVRTCFHSQLPFLPTFQDLLSRVVLWISLVFPR